MPGSGRTAAYRFADNARGVDRSAVLELTAHLGIDAGRGDQRGTGDVVDDLRVDIGVRASHAQTRPSGGAADLPAHPALPALELRLLRLQLVHVLTTLLDLTGRRAGSLHSTYLAALPSLRRTYSPS